MEIKNLGKRNRNAGNGYERGLAALFRLLGFPHAKTSRQASRLYDDCKLDLWGVPYAVQAKCGYKKNRVKPDIVFREMIELLKKNFPPDAKEHTYPKILFNKLDGYSDENHLVTMQYKEFMEVLKKAIEYDRKI